MKIRCFKSKLKKNIKLHFTSKYFVLKFTFKEQKTENSLLPLNCRYDNLLDVLI